MDASSDEADELLIDEIAAKGLEGRSSTRVGQGFALCNRRSFHTHEYEYEHRFSPLQGPRHYG